MCEKKPLWGYPKIKVSFHLLNLPQTRKQPRSGGVGAETSAPPMVLPPRKRQFAPNRPTVKFRAQGIYIFSCYFLVANQKVTKENCQKPSVSTHGSGPPCLMFAQCQKSHVHGTCTSPPEPFRSQSLMDMRPHGIRGLGANPRGCGRT